MKGETVKRFLSGIVCGICIQFIVVFLLLIPVLTQDGIPFYGDETWYIAPSSTYWYSRSVAYSWIEGQGPIVELEIPRILIITPLTYLVGLEYSVKLYILMTASLAGILTYFAFKILAEEWDLFKLKTSTRLMTFMGSLVMLVAFTNDGLIGAATASSWSYITLPISFALFVKYTQECSIKELILLSLISIFAIANPFWIYLMLIAGGIYLAFGTITTRRNRSILIKRSVITILTLISIHAFWLLPTLAGYISRAGGIFETYTVEKLISFGGLEFLSFWNLLDVIMVGEHQHYFFWLHPQNYGPLNIVIPIAASLTILIFRKNRYVLSMALILVIGIFLTKGVHEPGGYLYYLIAKNLPYGAGALLRNPTKFVPLVTFSYAILIGLFVAKVYEKLGFFKFKGFILKPSLIKYGALAVLALLVLSPVTYGTLLDLQGYTWPRYKPTYIPQIYDDVNSWLSQQQGNFKVMWIPSGGSYVWKPYIITAFPDLLSSRPAVSFYKIYPEPLTSTDRIGDVLTPLGVKYIIYHGDSLDYPKEILQRLLNQKDLKIVLYKNYTYLPEDNFRAPLARALVHSKEINVPFVVFENTEYNGPVYPSARASQLLECKQISPVEWDITVNSTGPFILTFTEPYDRLWRAYVNGKEVESTPLYGMVNGFQINDTGIIHIKLYYTLQTYYTIGLMVSLMSFISLVTLHIYQRRRRLKLRDI